MSAPADQLTAVPSARTGTKAIVSMSVRLPMTVVICSAESTRPPKVSMSKTMCEAPASAARFTERRRNTIRLGLISP